MTKGSYSRPEVGSSPPFRCFNPEETNSMVLRKYMGAPVKRREDPRLITGSSIYVDDLQLTGMVHVAFVRSMYAHANIKGIDASEALCRCQGLSRSLTADDLEKALPSKYQATGSDSGPAAEGGPAEPGKIPVPSVEPLARSKVRYIGEPIAAVIAETGNPGRRRGRARGRRLRAASDLRRPICGPRGWRDPHLRHESQQCRREVRNRPR